MAQHQLSTSKISSTRSAYIHSYAERSEAELGFSWSWIIGLDRQLQPVDINLLLILLTVEP